MNEQSNYANDNSIRESSNNSVEEDNIQQIGLTKFEQEKKKLKEDLLKPIEDEDSIYEA